MRFSNAGIELLKEFEGLRLKAYQDSVGVWTIGIGHTKGVKAGDVITYQQAINFLYQDIKEAETAVNRMVRVFDVLTQNQYDALVSLVYNIGAGNFQNSTVLKETNRRNFNLAADAFRRFNKGRVKGMLIELKGLTRRREAERTLFLTK